MSYSVLFRPQRGDFQTSYAETVRVRNTPEGIAAHLTQILGQVVGPSQITFEDAGFDKRLGTHNQYVLLDGQCVGYVWEGDEI